MASRFEDLIAWQKARLLVRAVYSITEDPRVSKDLRFCGQIQAAAVSVMSNIAEGFDKGTRAEFHRGLSIAKGSSAEVRSLLYVATDRDYVSSETFRTVYSLAEEVARITESLRVQVGKQREAEAVQRRNEARARRSGSLTSNL
jgi:four helix bundle protein